MTVTQLLKLNEDLISSLSNKTKELSHLEELIKQNGEELVLKTEEKEEIKPEGFTKKQNGFERELKKFFDKIDKLYDSEKLEEDIRSILLKEQDYDAGKIVKRLDLEFYKKIQEICKFIESETFTNEEDLMLFEEELELYYKKKDIIKNIFNNKTVEENVEQSKFIFLLNGNNRVRVIEDVLEIEKQVYPRLIVLLDSIKNGTFKSKKRFRSVNKEFHGISEVRDLSLQTRVYYDLLGDNTYVILGAIVKKDSEDSSYIPTMTALSSWYRKCKKDIVKSLQDEKYIQDNLEIEKQLYALLGGETKSSNSYIKKVNK